MDETQINAYNQLLLRGKYLAFECACTWIETMGMGHKISISKFVETLTAHFDAAFPEAYHDAGEAYMAGHALVAEVTFDTSLKLAGVRAAKEVMGIK